jgi:MFS family permease
MNPKEKNFSKRAFALLRQGPFQRYIIGSAISDTGTWMQVMAQGWVMSSLTDRGFLLGLAAAAAGVPTILLAMKGGEAADRYDKRKILIWTQVVQTILALILGFLVFSGRIQIWHVIVLAVCLGTCIAFEMPAINALVPEIVGKEEIATAIALDRSVFHGSRLVGPSLAGLFVGWWGAASAFFCNAATFPALIIALASLPPRKIGSAEEEEQRKTGFKEGLIYVRNDRTILCMIALIALSTIFVFPFLSAMLPLYVRNVLHLGPGPMGYLMAVSGSGSLLGALGLLSVPRHLRFRFMTGAVIIVGLALCSMSRSDGCVFSAISMGVLAIGLSANFGLASTIVQERAPSALRGRISAIFGLSFFGLTPVGSLLTPAFADLIGLRIALVIGGLIYGILAVVVLGAAGRAGCEKTSAMAKAGAEAQAAPVT